MGGGKRKDGYAFKLRVLKESTRVEELFDNGVRRKGPG